MPEFSTKEIDYSLYLNSIGIELSVLSCQSHDVTLVLSEVSIAHQKIVIRKMFLKLSHHSCLLSTSC